MVRSPPLVLLGFTYLFLAVGIYHRYVIWNRNRKKQRWHSKSIGDPLPFFYLLPKMDKMRIHRFAEPIFVLTIAFGMSFVDSIFVGYLLFCSIGLAFIAQLQYKKFRNQQLDMIDAEIESINLTAAMEEQPSSETEGFSLAGVKSLAPQLKKRLADKIQKQHKIDDALETAAVNPLANKPPVVEKQAAINPQVRQKEVAEEVE